jgi:hypothetical protein
MTRPHNVSHGPMLGTPIPTPNLGIVLSYYFGLWIFDQDTGGDLQRPVQTNANVPEPSYRPSPRSFSAWLPIDQMTMIFQI